MIVIEDYNIFVNIFVLVSRAFCNPNWSQIKIKSKISERAEAEKIWNKIFQTLVIFQQILTSEPWTWIMKFFYSILARDRLFQPSFGDISAICWWILMQNSVLETSLVVDYMIEIRIRNFESSGFQSWLPSLKEKFWTLRHLPFYIS